MEKMLAKISTRHYGAGFEPVGTARLAAGWLTPLPPAKLTEVAALAAHRLGNLFNFPCWAPGGWESSTPDGRFPPTDLRHREPVGPWHPTAHGEQMAGTRALGHRAATARSTPRRADTQTFPARRAFRTFL